MLIDGDPQGSLTISLGNPPAGQAAGYTFGYDGEGFDRHADFVQRGDFTPPGGC